jgi:cytochrome b
MMFTVRIWDLPTRLFHWALVTCIVALLITGNLGGAAMAWHFRFGYAVLTLVLFRLAWGLCGGFWSRWAQMPISLRHVRAYLNGHSDIRHRAGHNPLGSLSVIALLCVLLLQVGTGLVSDDEISNMGPLSTLVSGTVVTWASSWHKNVGKFILIALIAMHLLALAWYRFRKHPPLVPAMLHGNKTLPEPVPESADNGKSRVLALMILFSAALTVAALVSLGG